jgi:hypothetical protein
MSYCYGPHYKGYISNLSNIQKLIPQKYLYYKCILDKKRNFYIEDVNQNNLQIYNEKGLLKQLDLFKIFQNKFQYYYDKKTDETYIIRKDDIDNQKNIILLLFLESIKKYSNKILNYIQYILSNYSKTTIKNIRYYHKINNYKVKVSKKLNAKEEFDFKRDKYLKSKEKKDFDKEFNKLYKEAVNIIEGNKNTEEFQIYFKKYEKKFKLKNFDSEIKEIRKSIFCTCKVATKFKKLFPKY